MNFEQVVGVLEYALPILAGLIGAKFINQNSLPWHMWNGRVAKLLGLAVTILDTLRKPSQYVKDVAPDAIKKKVDKVKGGGKKFSAMMILPFMVLFTGCAGWQFTGDSWQETARIQIGNIAKVSGVLQGEGVPIAIDVCKEIASGCIDDCSKAERCFDVVDNVLDVFDEIDFYLRQAEIIVAIGSEKEVSDQISKASKLLRDVVAKLGEYGAL